MNTLKQVIHYQDTNSVEATWIDENGVIIKCHSYADCQMQMFRDDVAELGGDIAEYEELIALVESNIKPVEPPTPDQIIAAKKAERQAIVDAIVVTVSSGKVFDGNEEAQSRMSRAIQTAEIAGIESTTWVLANNVPTLVTLPELKEALVLSMQAMGAVWATPYED